MFRVLKEICDDKEKTKEQVLEVTASARCRGKASCEALGEHIKAFSDELASNAALVGVDGKVKNPKKKKVLTPEQECDRMVVTLFKKILSDEGKLSSQIVDLGKVPHSAELAATLETHKGSVKDILDAFDVATKGKEGINLATKKAAAEQATKDMSPIQKDMREAARRIKAAGIKPSKESQKQGRDQQERLSNAYAEYAAACRANSVRCKAPPFDLTAMKANPATGKFPTLAQKHLSGAESIILVRWLAGKCWAVASVTQSQHDLLRAGVFVGLDRLRCTFVDAGCVLSQQEREQAEFFSDLYHCSLMGALSIYISSTRLDSAAREV
ncbi:unnamed protein product [Symbiodinium sp. CCMP2592]|nr:unnamed protein product [Symbiodinium sp. CCMP2592]CAE7828431.1 unnamed protein product [Symbiodinium sp. CCMP2592]